MTIERLIDPNDGWDDQVGLRLRCTADEAQALYRALRLLFQGRMSPVLPRRHDTYTFILLIPTSAEMLERRWDEVLRLAGLSGFMSSAANALPVTNSADTQSQLDSARLSTIQSEHPRFSRPIRGAPRTTGSRDPWEQRFRVALKTVLDSESRTVTQTAALAINPGTGGREYDDAILLEALPPLRRLRALITRYANLGQSEHIVALCEQRYQDVLALPASELLVSQLLDAHLVEAERRESKAIVRAGRELALAFLPELERLRQSSNVRVRLRHTEETTTPSDTDMGWAPLAEQLDILMQVEPAVRIRRLDELHSRYPTVIAVRLALADAHAALGDVDQALSLYQSERTVDEAAERAAELLLEVGRFREALAETEGLSNLSPRMMGLRGSALAALGDTERARPLLDRSWRESERSPRIVLAYARTLVVAGDLEGAAEPYLIALEALPDALHADDCRAMADIALGGGYGDLSNEEQAQYLDRYIEQTGRRLRERPDAEETLFMRVELRRVAEIPVRLRESLADWIGYLGETGSASGLYKATQLLGQLRREGAITCADHYDLLEATEAFAADIPNLLDVLALEYQAIVLEELNLSLRWGRPMPAYISDVRRALHSLDPALADELSQQIEIRRQEIIKHSLSVPDQVIETAETMSLGGIWLTLIGGHVATRREIERELRERYSLTDYSEIAPSNDDHVHKAKVRDLVVGRDLVIVITGYVCHDLTNMVRDLQRSNDMTAHVIWAKCRGKSGVVREIVTACLSL